MHHIMAGKVIIIINNYILSNKKTDEKVGLMQEALNATTRWQCCKWYNSAAQWLCDF